MKYTLRDFLPLIIIFLLILTFVFVRQYYLGWNLMDAMQDFMAGFFLIFGAFKLLNWKGFVEAYKIYDIPSQKSTLYAYAYPLIEIGLGLAYLFRIFPIITNLITFLLMEISSVGVAKELAKKRDIPCACLGTVFKLPMTYVTLFEDVLMATMALIMLVIHIFK